MNLNSVSHSNELASFKVKIYEPFAEFLLADQDEYQFTISLLDVVRFSGHACPSMIGAFLISQRAIKELFPETNTCIRGQVAIEIPTAVSQGATGPISNVFSMIFGAWSESGFGGLQGQFVRRGLLRYESQNIRSGVFRFRNLKTGVHVDLAYDPSKTLLPADLNKSPFQNIWRIKITTILQNPNDYIKVVSNDV